STTRMSFEKVKIAIKSDGVIWVRRNFCAAVWARIWSSIGIEVMSKKRTMRRRSLYLMSPGFSGAIWLAVMPLGAGLSGFAAGAALGASGATVGAGAAATGAGAAVSSSF